MPVASPSAMAAAVPARRKSVALAYLLCATSGIFGLHRLYLGHALSGAGMFAISLLSVGLIWSGLGLLGFVATTTWALADLLLIPSMTRDINEGIAPL